MADTALSAQVEFEPAFLGNGSNLPVDLSRFERRNVASPGIYNVDVVVNDEWHGRFNLSFKARPGNEEALACFDNALLERLGLDSSKFYPHAQQQLSAAEACIPIDGALDDASSRLDFANQRLYLSVPQIAVKRSARETVDPSQWDSGITAGFLDYNLNTYGTQHRSQGNFRQTYLGLGAGLNIGPWRLRHDGSLNWSDQGQQRYQSIASYAQRDITPWRSQLTLGESYTSGGLFDSLSYTGIRLASDDRMLPASLRGYAPVVRGIASSNARVLIRQRGVTLHETTVAPGAFEIDDLYATGYGGDLEVTVTEADGREHSFSVPYAAVPLSLRAGASRYSATLGTLRNQQLNSDPVFVEGTWQYGLNNLVSTYSGMTLASGYGSALLGGSLNTELGAFGADLTQARTHLPGLGSQQGQSLRLSYAKTLSETDTQIALATYRYSTRGFYGLEDAQLSRQFLRDAGDQRYQRHRSRTTLSLAQPLALNYGQLHLSTSASSYWDHAGSDLSYSIGYSNHYKTLGYTLSSTRERDRFGRAGNTLYLSLSLPLGSERVRSLSSSISRDSNGNSRAQATLTGATSDDQHLSYGITASQDRHHGQNNHTLSSNLLYRGSAAELSGSLSQGRHTSQASLGLRGAIVAHADGLTLSQPLSETFGLIHAKDADGARVTSGTALKVDSGGYAVVPNLTPYRRNTVAIDPKGLSTDVELQSSSQQTVPRAGAIPLLVFQTRSGRSAVIHARQVDGQPLPFGAAVVDTDGNELGAVGQGSQLFARGLQDEGEIIVRWDNGSTGNCRITYALPAAAKKTAGAAPQNIQSVCLATPAHP
ncbi:fimbria/pilus outer membrane usher protein [Pseudomonas wadenswilerensis]|uniref:Outer membrane usher protein HifC n=1 Tax=Pseudomonas wadenswilerensis TaxID=1785161 RepID=A0A380T2F1_9PSED|nr:fimbria/pilus outer membrane usher protein [Pseudomonas wadenswilerensis]SUQ64417.1 Outer membrane usher protein HifC [Pseudomonas wadenswilerensis]